MTDEVKEFTSGFVALTGRPNVGKSTLLNQILDQKVSIVSNKAQTTRHRINGVLNRESSQIVFVDTPGISKPRTPLGTRLNESAAEARKDVDVVCFIIDAKSGFGRGDEFLLQELDPQKTVIVLNKIDGLAPEKIVKQLEIVSEHNFQEYFPLSAFTGKNVTPLVDYLLAQMPPGPRWFPEGMISDKEDAFMVAELVREQLLHIAKEELPHSIATRVVSWEWPVVKVEILVERESQKAIVIGKGGQVLKKVGSSVRRSMKKGAYLELMVKVNKNWQQRPSEITRLGY